MNARSRTISCVGTGDWARHISASKKKKKKKNLNRFLFPVLLLGLLHVFPPVVVRFWSLLACLFLCGVNIASLGIEPAYFFFIFFFFFPSFPLFSFASQRSLTYSGSYSSSLASSSGSSGSRSRQSRSRSRSNNSRRSARRCAGFMGIEVVAPVFPPTYYFFLLPTLVSSIQHREFVAGVLALVGRKQHKRELGERKQLGRSGCHPGV